MPAGVTLRIESDEYGAFDKPSPDGMTVDFALDRQVVAGSVLGAGGDPVQGAVVQSGDRTSVSTGDGTFELAGVASGGEVTVTASGYEDRVVAIRDS